MTETKPYFLSQLVTAYPEGDKDTPVGAPVVGETHSKEHSTHSSEENSDSKSASSSSEEKKGGPHAGH